MILKSLEITLIPDAVPTQILFSKSSQIERTELFVKPFSVEKEITSPFSFIQNTFENCSHLKEVKGLENIDKIINIDQSPIGRTPRSNPATYTNLFNDIREVFASTNDA